MEKLAHTSVSLELQTPGEICNNEMKSIIATCNQGARLGVVCADFSAMKWLVEDANLLDGIIACSMATNSSKKLMHDLEPPIRCQKDFSNQHLACFRYCEI